MTYVVRDAGPADAGVGDWWDDAWSHRVRVTIDHTSRAEALDAFPVLVRIDAADGVYPLADASGQSTTRCCSLSTSELPATSTTSPGSSSGSMPRKMLKMGSAPRSSRSSTDAPPLVRKIMRIAKKTLGVFDLTSKR